MSQRPQFQLGGQALIEGVMMRGPNYVAAAVRRADGTMETRVEPFESLLKKKPWLNKPLVRGIFALVEMMKLGMDYLQWSSNFALEDETAKKQEVALETASHTASDAHSRPAEAAPVLTDPLVAAPIPISPAVLEPVLEPGAKKLPIWLFFLTVLGSLGFGALLFVLVPNFIAHFVFGPHINPTSPWRSVFLTWIEGGVKLLIFIAYVWLIGQRSAIKRVFEYHGAEHKVVYAAENQLPLTPEAARPFDTPHPRCGTGFALITIFVSIVCYSFLHWPENHFLRIGQRLCLLPLVAGISYEIIKGTVSPTFSGFATFVVTPGMWLQRLTTRQPDDEQLEVACEAMRVLLDAEKNK